MPARNNLLPAMFHLTGKMLLVGALRRTAIWRLVTFIVIAVAACCAQDPSQVGQWSAVQNLPFRPIHTALLPTGKLLFWSYYNEAKSPQIWDPANGQTVPAA